MLIELTEVVIESDQEFEDFLSSIGQKDIKFSNITYPIKIPMAR